MTTSGLGVLCDPVLEACGVPHGFGVRGSQVPDETWFPRQVHGIGVVLVERAGAAAEADACVSFDAGRPVGIVTADCVPILVAGASGERVAAIHAGWRGLAAGVIEAGLAALGLAAGELRAAVGPAARGCCYEVDEPVRAGLEPRYGGLLPGVLEAGRPGRYQLDLSELAVRVLGAAGLARDRIGTSQQRCTICSVGRPGDLDPWRSGLLFESFRRDGARAGRLRHFIGPRPGGGRGSQREP